MATERRAETVWQGDLMNGSGTIQAAPSGAFGPLDVSWASRAEEPGGKTSPEELIAAAHASCFAMALSGQLGERGMTAESLEATATVTIDRVDGKFSVTSSQIDLAARIPNADRAKFDEAVKAAETGCPISRLLNTKISVDAKLL